MSMDGIDGNRRAMWNMQKTRKGFDFVYAVW